MSENCPNTQKCLQRTCLPPNIIEMLQEQQATHSQAMDVIRDRVAQIIAELSNHADTTAEALKDPRELPHPLANAVAAYSDSVVDATTELSMSTDSYNQELCASVTRLTLSAERCTGCPAAFLLPDQLPTTYK